MNSQPQPTAPQPRLWEQIVRLVMRWLVSTLAIFLAVLIVPGIEFAGPGWQLGVVAVLFGLVNALLRPLIAVLTCPLILMTFGLFGLVINAAMLLLTAQLAAQVGVVFRIDGLWAAVLGGVLISIVTLVFNLATGEVRGSVVRQP
ncbi:MAG: phage holin family protein [Roseiflexaceae bacterium]|nr:phage holin family protein [Roseiflexaceae bacterium]